MSKVLEIIIRKQFREQMRMCEAISSAKLKGLSDGLKEKAISELDELLKNNQNVLQVINDYLEAAKPEVESTFHP